MKTGLTFLLCIIFLSEGYAQHLTVPKATNHSPKAGKRVKVTPKESDIYYTLYLPKNYKKGKKYPVIVEYTGNKWEPSGSTGEVKDANLGYAIAKRIEAIWIVLPYIENGKSVTNWWGNEEETIKFALNNIKKVCENYGGDPSEIFLCGFSRGAIGVNYLGLHNDQISEVWLGFFSHDHYDGVSEWKGTDWGSPLTSYREAANERMRRIKGRNYLISQNILEKENTFETKQYIEKYNYDTLANIQYNWFSVKDIVPDIPSKFIPHSHTDKWLLYESEYANTVYNWFLETIKSKPNTYSVTGKVTNLNGKPIKGLVVESSFSHFSVTNKKGEFNLDGLTYGLKRITIKAKRSNLIKFTKEIELNSDLEGLKFKISCCRKSKQ